MYILGAKTFNQLISLLSIIIKGFITYFSHFNHLQGSLMEGDDLDRVQADNADAVLILTNKYCQVDIYTYTD